MAQRKIDYQVDLVSRLKGGDPAAQFEAFEAYKVAMYNTALRIVQDVAEAEDVLQESFLAAFTKIGLFTGESSFGGWLKTIVINKSINALKKQKASLSFKEQLAQDAAAQQGTRDEDDNVIWNVQQITRAVQALPDGYRVVLSLYLFEGYDHREIAEILGISEGGSKSQFNRAKSKLREILTTLSYV